jgi:hypothetical protein
MALVVLTVFVAVAFAQDPTLKNFGVHAAVFDPAKTDLVFAKWEVGAGCPTSAGYAIYPSVKPSATFADAGCTTGDPDDHEFKGLLLIKTGPTANNAAAGANITGLDNKVTSLTEIGYDLRKGSHCGGGAPRFNITTTTGKFYFLACASPSPTTTTVGTGWNRLRWGNGNTGSVVAFCVGSGCALVQPEPILDPIASIQIVFDEGQDVGSGLAVLDNIDINGVLQGKE